MKKIICLFLLVSSLASAQSTYAPLDQDYNWLIDRFNIKANSGNNFTAIKPFQRKDVARMADSLLKDTSRHFSKVDIKNLEYLQHDNWEWSNVADSGNSKKPILKYLYRKRNDFYDVDTKGFQFQLNPIMYFSFGKENYDSVNKSGSRSDYINTRGFEFRGMIDNKVGFYTMLTDNQARFPMYVEDRVVATGTVPGEGYWKPYGNAGYDFYSASGYIDFNVTKHISTQFGVDKNIIGDGYRSLMLSDYSPNYLFLKVDTKVWKFDYVNMFGEMVANNFDDYTADINYPRKYIAMHYISIHLAKTFDLGLFEAVTFGNTDTIHNRGFDLNYLNPIIFYNAVENGLGAPDKDHVGANFKWNICHHISLYGSVVLDEFNFQEIKAHNGWWGNKQAFQGGLKYIDVFGIHNLDMQLEGNMVPPYTYTHFSYSTVTDYSYFANYSNYDQPLADPNGANFYEGIAILRYQPCFKLTLTGKFIYTRIGLDSTGQDWGSNIMINYNDRERDYGNFIGQGESTTIKYMSFTASWQLAHNMFIDLTAIMRNESSQLSSYNSNDMIFNLAFRWNIAKRLQEF
jgi:hypothetical protein